MALAALEPTIEAIYRAAAEPDKWSRALEVVADHVGAIGALIAFHDFRRNEGFLTTGRLREDLNDLYVRQYGSNHYSVEITRRPAHVPFVGRSLVAPDVVRRSAMHADIFLPQKIAEQVMIGHAPFIRDGSTGGFAVMLDARGADNSSDVARRLARLAPHLSNAIELSRVVARHQIRSDRTDWLLEQLPGAALLLDVSGCLVDANDAGAELLGKSDVLALREGGRIAPTSAHHEPVFARLLLRTLGDVAGVSPGRLWMRLQSPAGHRMIITFMPLPRSAFASWQIADRDAEILIQVHSLKKPSRAGSAAMLRALYDLTDAEARVAVSIARGLSTPAVAAELRVSVNTVRTHLSRCFDKTAARSQVALARLLADLPDL